MMNSCYSRARMAVVAAAVLACAGCPEPSAQKSPTVGTPKQSQPLTLLVVDDPELGQAIAREWQSRTEEKATVKDITAGELAVAHRLPGDAVIFPSGLLGTLAERSLIVPPDATALEEPLFDYRDIFGLIRQREMKWGNRTVAVPLGSPQLLLAYRADIFEKLSITPPADWVEYEAVMARLADRAALGELAPASDRPWRAAIEPLADGWAGQLLLARAATYALHRDQVSPLFQFDSLAPLIDQQPYVRALEELASAAKAGDFAKQRMSPAEAFAELRAGSCGMAIAWPAPRGNGKADVPSAAGKIRFALLPGSKQAYRFATKSWEERGPEEEIHVPLLGIAGRMAAVSSSTADQKRAQGFVIWLSSREASDAVGPKSTATTLFRTSQVSAAGPWTGELDAEGSRAYAEVLSKTLGLPRAVGGVILPGRLDYLAALDKAVQQAAALEKQPAEALGEAAGKWREITEKLGSEAQRKANARSLGEEGGSA